MHSLEDVVLLEISYIAHLEKGYFKISVSCAWQLKAYKEWVVTLLRHRNHTVYLLEQYGFTQNGYYGVWYTVKSVSMVPKFYRKFG